MARWPRTAAIVETPAASRWSAPARNWVRHPAKAKIRRLISKVQSASSIRFGGYDMRHRVIIVCSALVLALIIVAAAPLLLRAQGPQAQQGQQGQPAVQGQGQPAVQGQGQQGQRGGGQG